MEKKLYRTIAEQVFERLRQEILANELPYGSGLKEENISSRFGVSRGPVREAFKELTRFGLISPRGKAGYKVSDPLSEEVHTLVVDLRRNIEIFVTGAVLESLTESDFANLEAILDQQHEACLKNEKAVVRETDMRFHEYLVKKFKNNHVEDLWRSVVNRMMMKYARHRTLLNNHSEHKKILDYLKAKDFDGAAEALRQNIQ